MHPKVLEAPTVEEACGRPDGFHTSTIETKMTKILTPAV